MTKDCKHLREELLLRESYSWRNGWQKAEYTALVVLWTINVVLAYVVFW